MANLPNEHEGVSVLHAGVIVLHAGVIVLHGGVVVLHGGVGVQTQYLLRRAEGQLQKVNGKPEGHGTQTRLEHDSLN
jgi:hypothetical protein